MKDNIGKDDNRIYYSLTAPQIPRITRLIPPEGRVKQIVKRIFRRK